MQQDSSVLKLKIMVVAGEASGDTHAAALVRALRKRAPKAEFEFFGSTGPKMREANVETIVKADDLAIVGVPEIARALPMFWKTFQVLRKAAIEKKPDAVVLVDFPDFNLRLAKALKKAGLKVIYYISPQLWAWRKYRVKNIKRDVDLLLTILPFEKDWYAKHGVSNVEYVGNPLDGEVRARYDREEFCRLNQLDPSKQIISLLPGSRGKEISRHLPVLLETAEMMAARKSDLQFVVAFAASRDIGKVESDIRAAKRGREYKANIVVVHGQTFEALAASDCAAVTSGTATLETAIIGTPLVIVYKSSLFNYLALRPLINVEHFGLVNLIAKKRLAKELIQYDFTKENLSAELFRLLEPENSQKMRNELRQTAEKLGSGGASERAAGTILQELRITV